MDAIAIQILLIPIDMPAAIPEPNDERRCCICESIATALTLVGSILATTTASMTA